MKLGALIAGRIVSLLSCSSTAAYLGTNSKHWFTTSFWRKVLESDARSVIWALSLRLCSAQLLKEQAAEYTSCFALARSPCTSLTLTVLAMADGLFGLYGSERKAELFRPPHPTHISSMWFLWTLRNMKKREEKKREEGLKKKKNVPSTAPVHHRRGGRPGLSVLTSLLVSVDVKLYWTMLRHWSQLVPNMSTDIWGH